MLEFLTVKEAATAFFAAGIFVALAVPLVRVLAQRVGAVDSPGGRRIHLDSVPRLGGIAVVLGVLASLTLVVGRLDVSVMDDLPGWSGRLGWVGLGAATWSLLILGVRDDVAHVGAGTKLLVELAGAVLIIALFPVAAIDFGVFQVPASMAPVSAIIVILWMATVTNAYNMIDGLDGLAAGVGAIAAAALAVGAWLEGNGPAALALVAISGALTGFLVHNRHPARIFMGDAGSLPVGFLLASLGFIGLRQGNTWYAAPAVIALALPLIDLVVAIVRRFLDAVHVTRKDEIQERFHFSFRKTPGLFRADGRHLHHRLLSLGLSRRWTVVVLYLAAFAFALLSLATDRWRDAAPVAFVLLVTVFGFLVSGRLYDELRLLRRGVLLPLFDTRLARSRAVHGAYDFLAFGAAFVLGRKLLQWDWGLGFDVPGLALRGLAVGLVAVAVFWAVGIYQFSFKRVGQWALSRTTLAVGFAILVAAAVDILAFAEALHWSSWLLTAYLSLTFTLAPRLSYRVLDSIYQRARAIGRRVVIFGAGRGGRVTLRELLENREVGMIPVGFLDDDPALWTKVVEGLEIFPSGDRLLTTLARLDVDVLLVSSRKVPRKRLLEIIQACDTLGIEVRRAEIIVGKKEAFAEISEPIAGVIGAREEVVEAGIAP